MMIGLSHLIIDDHRADAEYPRAHSRMATDQWHAHPKESRIGIGAASREQSAQGLSLTLWVHFPDEE